MKRLWIGVIVPVLVLSGFAQTKDLCSIQGHVTGTAGEPLRKAEVTLAAEGPSGTAYAATSDADGSFALDEIPAGQYQLSAKRTGYLEQAYGGHPGQFFGGRGMLVTLTPGQHMTGIDFQLVRHAVITGRIVDEDGDPAANINVELLRELRQRGERQLIPMQNTQTNDLGEYRIAGLAPGSYYLCASCEWPGAGPQQIRVVRKGPEQTVPATYYPGTLEQSQAGTIQVAPGAQLQGYDVQLRKVRAFRVSGRVVLPEDVDGDSLLVHLRPKMPKASFGTVIGGDEPLFRPGGSFDFGGIIPGSYELVAMYNTNNHQRSTRLPVEVTDRNIEDLVVQFPAKTGVAIEGVVLGVPAQPANLGHGGAVAVTLRNLDNPEVRVSASANRTGVFSLQDVEAGRYKVMIYNPGEGGYLQAVLYGGQESKDRVIQVSERAGAKLEVLLAFDSGTVTGSVQDESGAAVPGAAVFVVPKSEEEDCECSQMANTDQNGRFVVRGVAPGEYVVTAVPASALDSDLGADFHQGPEANASAASVTRNGIANVTVKLGGAP